MRTVYAVFYSFYAEGVEKTELEAVYETLEAAQKHNTMTPEELAWAGITAVTIAEQDVL